MFLDELWSSTETLACLGVISQCEITELTADTLYRVKVISEVGTVISSPSEYGLINTQRDRSLSYPPLSTTIYMKSSTESDNTMKLEVS